MQFERAPAGASQRPSVRPCVLGGPPGPPARARGRAAPLRAARREGIPSTCRALHPGGGRSPGEGCHSGAWRWDPRQVRRCRKRSASLPLAVGHGTRAGQRGRQRAKRAEGGARPAGASTSESPEPPPTPSVAARHRAPVGRRQPWGKPRGYVLSPVAGKPPQYRPRAGC